MPSMEMKDEKTKTKDSLGSMIPYNEKETKGGETEYFIFY
jgi:hypothetical protein